MEYLPPNTDSFWQHSSDSALSQVACATWSNKDVGYKLQSEQEVDVQSRVSRQQFSDALDFWGVTLSTSFEELGLKSLCLIANMTMNLQGI